MTAVEHALMIPGPCALAPEVLAVVGAPVRPHYGPEWSAAHAAVLADLRRLLAADRTYLIPGTGTASLDAAMFNLFEPGQRVVVPDTGYFGSRLVAMARAHELRVRRVPVTPGQPVDVARVADELTNADGVLVTHVETATGVRHPVAAIAAAAHSAGAHVLVDAIASAGGEELAMTTMGLDAVVTASQKGLGGPPGLGIVALTARGVDRVHARSRPPQSWYFDLRNWDEAGQESPDWEPHPVTMPTNLVLAVAASVRRILATGPPVWVAERARLARACRDGLRELGLTPMAAEEHAANLVLVLRSRHADRIRRQLDTESGILVAKGLAPFESDVVRIGLVGHTATPSMVARLIAATRTALC